MTLCPNDDSVYNRQYWILNGCRWVSDYKSRRNLNREYTTPDATDAYQNQSPSCIVLFPLIVKVIDIRGSLIIIITIISIACSVMFERIWYEAFWIRRIFWLFMLLTHTSSCVSVSMEPWYHGMEQAWYWGVIDMKSFQQKFLSKCEDSDRNLMVTWVSSTMSGVIFYHSFWKPLKAQS